MINNSSNQAIIKNCLLVFRNKKLNNFIGAENIINGFSGLGYYFDKISYVAYDSSAEIVRAVKEGKENYENLILYCPAAMENTLKNFVSNLYGETFNEIGILKSGNANAFMLFSDMENRLLLRDIKKILDEKYGLSYGKTFIKAIGASASEINSAVEKAEKVCPEISFNVSGKYGDCTIGLIFSENLPKSAHDNAMRIILSCLNDYVYAIEDKTVEEMLFGLLKLRRMKIGVAESFTGGGVGKRLVGVSGISEVYYEGLNTYSNEAKIKRLGVREMTVKQFGAVSKETAQEMAQGLLSGGDCDIAVSTTGIAGPKSDNTLKPVGLCYIGVGTREKVSVYEFNLSGTRTEIAETATNLALFLAYKYLK